MKRLLILLLCAAPVFAGPETKPEAPRAKVADKQYWAAMSVLAASKAADGITTEHMLSRGCAESDALLFGRYPSPAKVASVNAGYLAGEMALAYLLKRSAKHHLWLAEPAYQTIDHLHLSVRNETMACHEGTRYVPTIRPTPQIY